MKGGFTLIELIIYIAIVTVVLILASDFAWNIIKGDTKAMVYREVQQNAQFAMEKITRALRLGQSPGIFNISDDILYQDSVAITSDLVRVTNLQFVPIANTYQINLTIEYNNPSGRQEYQASIYLKSTASARP